MDLAWDGCVNVRDLGGIGRVRAGAVVRMEAPTRLTAAGWAAAWAYGVRTVIDLRDPDEGQPDDVARPVGITTVSTPMDPVGTPFYERWTKIDHLATPLYFPALLAEHPERVIAPVRAIAKAEPGCVVFHCAGGKDRTGLLALVLLTLADATPDEIVADYLLSYDRMQPLYDELGHGDQLAGVIKLLAERDTTIEASLAETIEATKVFLDNVFPAADLEVLRARLV